MSKYGKYFKDIAKYLKLDIYRILDLYKVTDHAIGHAVKKLLLAGDRTGGKSIVDDVTEARDTLNRWLEMHVEDLDGNPVDTRTLDEHREYTLEEVTRGVTLSDWTAWVAVDADGEVWEYCKRPYRDEIGWFNEAHSCEQINKVAPPSDFTKCIWEIIEPQDE